MDGGFRSPLGLDRRETKIAAKLLVTVAGGSPTKVDCGWPDFSAISCFVHGFNLPPLWVLRIITPGSIPNTKTPNLGGRDSNVFAVHEAHKVLARLDCSAIDFALITSDGHAVVGCLQARSDLSPKLFSGASANQGKRRSNCLFGTSETA